MRGTRLSRLLQRTGWVFALAGISLLAYCGFVLWQAREFQLQESRALDSLELPAQSETVATSPAPPEAVPVAAAVARRRTPQSPRGLVGRVEVPRLGLAAMVIEGSDAAVLRRAVGHVPGTALPGEAGNVAITGHRDTFFRPLRNIRQDDLIHLTTPKGQFWYRVTSISVVAPDNIAVLQPGSGEALTMVTCFPFSFVGSAPRRFVVHAERVAS